MHTSLKQSLLLIASCAALASVSLLGGCAASVGSASAAPSMADKSPDGLITLASPRSPKDTMDKLEATVKERGFAVVARVDHAAGATRVGKTLRPTELIIFGNPAGGTPLMECAQSAGIDLPLKALVWADAAGKTQLGYIDPSVIAKRHAVPDCPAAANMSKALDGLMKSVVAP
jgi:uncharacterized protein (DUF302 family)